LSWILALRIFFRLQTDCFDFLVPKLSLLAVHRIICSTFAESRTFLWKREYGWNWEHIVPNLAHPTINRNCPKYSYEYRTATTKECVHTVNFHVISSSKFDLFKMDVQFPYLVQWTSYSHRPNDHIEVWSN